jgi:uracil-DNA glycosylase
MKAHDSLPALSELLDPRWKELIPNANLLLAKLEEDIDFSKSLPSKDLIFKAFECDPKSVSVVIFGQDPYPNAEHAMGLAFSVKKNIRKLPASLRNIFTEIKSDIGGADPVDGDLAFLSEQGVMLLNRGLALELESKKVSPLWYQFTNEVAKILGTMGVIGIFWGNRAQELVEYFPANKRILSAHPSPLSAYKGFFGSKPFSKVNNILYSEGKKTIEWTKQ